MAKPAKREDKRPIGAEEEIVRASVISREVLPNYVSLYANDTLIQISPWDIRMIFGEISGVPSEGTQPGVTVKLTGEVRMSPMHAKRVLGLLKRQIDLYEEMIGPIPMPKEPTLLPT